MKLKSSNCDGTQKLKLGLTPKLKLVWNSKTQIESKLKNSSCDETQKLILWWNLKTQAMMKLKHLNCDKTKKNSNGDKTLKLKWWQKKKKSKLWHKSITQTMKKNQIVTKKNHENSICDNSQKLKLWWYLNYDKFQLMQRMFFNDILIRTFWHLDNQWDVLWASFCNSCNVLIYVINQDLLRSV